MSPCVDVLRLVVEITDAIVAVDRGALSCHSAFEPAHFHTKDVDESHVGSGRFVGVTDQDVVFGYGVCLVLTGVR